MSEAFSLRNPVVMLNNLQTETDRNEQEGFMYLFMGAMQGIRNPEAHEIRDLKDPVIALEYLALSSLLLRKLDEGKVLDGKIKAADIGTTLTHRDPTTRQRQLPLELVDRVYNPLIKEVTTWRDNPTKAFFSEWNRLNIEERYWVKKVPSQITKRFEEAEILFGRISQLRLTVQTFISTTLSQLFGDSWLAKAEFPKEEGLGNVDFRVLIEENPVAVIYLSWLWESGKPLKEYIQTIVPRIQPSAKLALRTTIFSSKGGTGKIVAENDETYAAIERIVDLLKDQEPASDLLRKLDRVKQLGDEILAASDEEFKA